MYTYIRHCSSSHRQGPSLARCFWQYENFPGAEFGGCWGNADSEGGGFTWVGPLRTDAGDLRTGVIYSPPHLGRRQQVSLSACGDSDPDLGNGLLDRSRNAPQQDGWVVPVTAGCGPTTAAAAAAKTGLAGSSGGNLLYKNCISSPPGALPDGGRGLGGRELGPPALLYRVRHQLRDLLT